MYFCYHPLPYTYSTDRIRSTLVIYLCAFTVGRRAWLSSTTYLFHSFPFDCIFPLYFHCPTYTQLHDLPSFQYHHRVVFQYTESNGLAACVGSGQAMPCKMDQHMISAETRIGSHFNERQEYWLGIRHGLHVT